MASKPTSPPGKYRGRACALLAVCLVTLIGVASGLDPDVILWRAAVSGVVIGIVVTVAVRMIESVLEDL